MLLKKTGRTQSAAEKFTECLEIGSVYDPEIRRKCLEELKEIFEVMYMDLSRVFYFINNAIVQ